MNKVWHTVGVIMGATLISISHLWETSLCHLHFLFFLLSQLHIALGHSFHIFFACYLFPSLARTRSAGPERGMVTGK